MARRCPRVSEIDLALFRGQHITTAMKTDAVEIDKLHLAQIIRSGYGINILDIKFLPKGEDSYVYEAQDLTGKRYFVRLQPSLAAKTLEKAYEITQLIRSRCGLSQIVAPCRAKQGKFTQSYGRFIVAIFPFVPGETLHQQRATEADLMAAATLLARLHQCSLNVNGLALHRESFANPFKATILQALATAEAAPSYRTHLHRRACTLLLKDALTFWSHCSGWNNFKIVLSKASANGC